MTRTMRMPDVGEGVVEVELLGWLVSVGDVVTLETPIAEIATDKSSVEINAPVTGVVTAQLVEAGQIVAVGTEILTIDVGPAASGDEPAAPERGPTAPVTIGAPAGAAAVPMFEPVAMATAPAAAPPLAAPATTSDGTTRPIAAPTVRRLARDVGIDLAQVRGTGPHGRILREDVEAHGRTTTMAPAAPPRRPDEVVAVRGVRRVIATRLSTSWEAPHFTLVDDVDLTELESARRQINDEVGDPALRVTPLAFIARAVVLASVDHPTCNATYDVGAGTVTRYGSVHLGIATRTDRGLVVPVVRDADQCSLTDLASGIRRLANAARDGRASREELSGSTITITSLGALGGVMNTPILNAPEVAIVGVNKLRTEPVWNGSSFVPRQVMNLSASFDHRIVDGWDGAVFLRAVKQRLEAPTLLAFGWAR